MPLFQVVGICEKSGRARRKIYRGYDETEVKAMALHDDGLIAKWIEPHPYKPATDVQKQRLTQMGYQDAEGLNVKEAGDLLRAILDGDQPADRQSLAYARFLRIETTAWTGQKQLFDAIFRKLMQPGNEQRLVAWFTFRVYKTLATGDNRAIIDGPEHAVIQRIAQFLISDAEVMGAIKGYGAGRKWVRFGHYFNAQGQVQRGGRMDTVAYRQAKACFEQAFEHIPKLRPQISRDAEPAGGNAFSLPSLSATETTSPHRTSERLKAS